MSGVRGEADCALSRESDAGHDPRTLGSNPTWGSLLSGKPASPSPCTVLPACALLLSLSQINK